MTAMGIVEDVVNMTDPVVRTGRITEGGYAIFAVLEGAKHRYCCVSGLEYQLYGDLCYGMNDVQVAVADSELDAIAQFQSWPVGGHTDEPSCCSSSL